MNRRDFIKTGLLGGFAVQGSLSGLSFPFSNVLAGSSLPFQRTLVHTMLVGGADFRYVFAPAPDSDPVYISQYWSARKALYLVQYPDYATMFSAEYLETTDAIAGKSFGIHKSCSWLAQQFSDGNVAIIANVFGSENRRHDHSQIIMNTGDPGASRTELDRNGWGGRLVEAVSSESSIVSVGGNVPVFCQGNNPANRLRQVFHAKDMRKIALPTVNATMNLTQRENILTRSLISYYQSRGLEVELEKNSDWPYHRFFHHYNSLDSMGSTIANRLADFSEPLPDLNLQSSSYEQQCRNLYDCCLVQDVLNMNVISMVYGDWDHHVALKKGIEKNLKDVFGTGGGLDAVSSQLTEDVPGVIDNLVYTFGSDFGRQLAANGSLGSDHGIGSYSVLVGKPVNGGVYGDLFPLREAVADPADGAGRTPFEIPGRDIQGLTSFERVFEKVCDWVSPGSGGVVFPGASSSKVEKGVDLSNVIVI